MPDIVILIGISGVGKTAVGSALARELGWSFVDADDLHSAANVAKMRRGQGLSGADRAPWLAALRARIKQHLDTSAPLVLACSALKTRYRESLRLDERVQFVWLDVSRDEVAERLRTRSRHFAGEALLPSQWAAFELPSPGEALRIDASGSVDETMCRVIEALGFGAS